ncbi:MAG: LysR family transcriptional regulator [Desulfobulbaceae bacterium]|uniref:LysR family transcriptional regulator n=1 Tax=Candidatus Desulfobia pelagia TaxID=2841692 RepID=A0A8J6TDM8_9BACT|nr:LysR family transcriptional regulator [Candidatus Desulfobia pelagia]
MAITFRQLEIFNAVVETQQVTRASKKLFITQSAVSLAIIELENQLGGPLFDRQGRSLILNDRGRYLLPLSREISDQMNNVCSLMNEKDGNIVGSLNLVASSTIGNYVLPYLISAFKQMHPDVYITMLVLNTRAAEKLIVDRKVDIGFVEGEVNNEQVQVTPWFKDELVLISNIDNLTEDSDVCNVATDLKKYKWIMREQGSGTAQIFKKKLGKHVTDLNIIMELGHTEAIKNAVKSGAGVGCLSNLTVCSDVENGRLKRLYIKGVDMERQLSVIQHKNKTMTKLMQELLDFCFLMSQCSHGQACLSSPHTLMTLVEQFDVKK